MTLSHAFIAKVDEKHNECRRKEKIGLGFTEVKPPFNHNYSIMPNINTSVDDLLLKSDRRCDFTTGSNKPVPFTTDHVATDRNVSDDSEVCADSLSDTCGHTQG
ncbi:hypothetical protein R6Q57_006163 [Mikania cordata]